MKKILYIIVFWAATAGLAYATTLSVPQGGTGTSTYGQGWLHTNGTSSPFTASTSPTVNYLVATSTTASSTFASWLDVKGGTTGTSTFTGNVHIKGVLQTGTGSIFFGPNGIILTGSNKIILPDSTILTGGNSLFSTTSANYWLTQQGILDANISSATAWNAKLDAGGALTGTFDGQEGTYYLNARNLTQFGNPFWTFFNSTTTDALTVGSTNKYYTSALAQADCATITGGAGLCDGTDNTGGASDVNYDAWSHPIWGGSATTSLITLQGGFLSYGSSTLLGTITLGSLTATSSITGNSGLTITAGTVDFPSGAVAIADLAASTISFGNGTCTTGSGSVSLGGSGTVSVTSNCTDAATVDSIEGASLLRSDATDSYSSGTLTFDSATTLSVAGSLIYSNAATSTFTALKTSLGLQTSYISSSGRFELGTGSATSTLQYDPDSAGGQITMATTSSINSLVVLASGQKLLWSASIASTSIDLTSGFNRAGVKIPLPAKMFSVNANTMYCAVWGGTNVAIRIRQNDQDIGNTITCTTTSTSTPFTITPNGNFPVTSSGGALEIVSVSGASDWLWFSIYGTTTPI